MTGRFDKAAIAEVLARVDLAELARAVVPDLKRRGGEWVGCCPFHGERTASFTIWVSGGVQRFKCFGCGAAGDAIGFVMQAHRLDFPSALAALAGDAGIEADPQRLAQSRERAERARVEADRRESREKFKRMAKARQVWILARAASCSIVKNYLADARGIDFDAIGGMPPTIRFISGAVLARLESSWGWSVTDRHDAMVAAVQSPDGAVVAVHLTFLAPGGRGKAGAETVKRMIGPAWGGAVRFGPPAARMFVAEGIETALSVFASLSTGDPRFGPGGVLPTTAGAGPGDFSVWAALSLGNISGGGLGQGARRRPGDPKYLDRRGRIARLPSEMPNPIQPGLILPAQCTDIVICADGDGKDPPAGRAQVLRAAARWLAEGRRVEIAWPPAGMDFNDLIRGVAAPVDSEKEDA